jgi:hypothetical protein
MSRHARSLIVVALVLAVAGVAAANGALTPSSSTVTSGAVVAGPMFAQLSTTPTTVGPTTNGVPATVLAQSPSIGGPPTASTGVTSASTGVTIDQIVSLTRVVEAGTTALNVFTVPAGRLFVLTDALLTNPGAAAACGASIAPSGPSTPTAIEPGTGVLCVPAQTSLNLGLTTGMEFTGGQGVLLGNVATPPGTGGALHFHLRGFLATLGV